MHQLRRSLGAGANNLRYSSSMYDTSYESNGDQLDSIITAVVDVTIDVSCDDDDDDTDSDDFISENGDDYKNATTSTFGDDSHADSGKSGNDHCDNVTNNTILQT